MSDWKLARSHLEHDLKHWGHPEAALMLAKVLIAHGDFDIARGHLQTLFTNLRAAPRCHYRHQQQIIKQAEKLSKTLAS